MDCESSLPSNNKKLIYTWWTTWLHTRWIVYNHWHFHFFLSTIACHGSTAVLELKSPCIGAWSQTLIDNELGLGLGLFDPEASLLVGCNLFYIAASQMTCMLRAVPVGVHGAPRHGEQGQGISAGTRQQQKTRYHSSGFPSGRTLDPENLARQP